VLRFSLFTANCRFIYVTLIYSVSIFVMFCGFVSRIKMYIDDGDDVVVVSRCTILNTKKNQRSTSRQRNYSDKSGI